MARAAVSLVRDPAAAAGARDHVNVRDRAIDARAPVIGVGRVHALNDLDQRNVDAIRHRDDAATHAVATARVAGQEGRGITEQLSVFASPQNYVVLMYRVSHFK